MAEIPGGLKYTKEHEWVRADGGGEATIGITDFAQDKLGDVVFLDLPEVGATIAQFEKMGEIESVKSVSELFAPVTGEVTTRNDAAIDSPELVNSSPYNDGWMIRVRLSDPAELDKLLSGDEYAGLIADQG